MNYSPAHHHSHHHSQYSRDRDRERDRDYEYERERDREWNSRDARDARDSRDSRDVRDSRDSRDHRDTRDSRDSRDHPHSHLHHSSHNTHSHHPHQSAYPSPRPPPPAQPPNPATHGIKRPAIDSDLPVSPIALAKIEALKTTFKKRGHFDTLRKDVFNGFSESDAKPSLTAALQKIATSELERDPSLHSKDRAKAMLLVEGAAERAPDVYPEVEKEIELLLKFQRRRFEELVRGILEEESAGDNAAADSNTESKHTKHERERGGTRGSAVDGRPGAREAVREREHGKEVEGRHEDRRGQNGYAEHGGSRWDQSSPRRLSERPPLAGREDY